MCTSCGFAPLQIHRDNLLKLYVRLGRHRFWRASALSYSHYTPTRAGVNCRYHSAACSGVGAAISCNSGGPSVRCAATRTHFSS